MLSELASERIRPRIIPTLSAALRLLFVASLTSAAIGNASGATIPRLAAAGADLTVTIADAVDPIPAGSTTTYGVQMKNLGDDPAANPAIAFSMTGGTMLTISTPPGYGCSITPGSMSATCSSTSPLAAGATASFSIVGHDASGTAMSLTAAASSATSDPVPGNNSATENTAVVSGADLSIVKSGPAGAGLGETVTFTLLVTNHGPLDAAGVVVSDPTPSRYTLVSVTGACSSFPCSLGSMRSGESATITVRYSVTAGPLTSVTNTASVSTTTSDPDSSNDSSSVTTKIGCSGVSPQLLSPAQNSTNVAASGLLTWTDAGATSYDVYLAPLGANGCSSLGPLYGSTTTPQLPYANLTPGTAYEWHVVAKTAGGCVPVESACGRFTVASGACVLPDSPLASVVAAVTTGQTYAVTWSAPANTTIVEYEVDEATTASFADALTTKTSQRSVNFAHLAPQNAAAYFYRVRARSACGYGAYSPTIRSVILPLPAATDLNPSINAPAGSQTRVSYPVFVPGLPNETFPFTAAADQPWLAVVPASGLLPPEGVTLTVTSDPSHVPNGTVTGTVVVTLASSKVSVPVSMNLVTPVTPAALAAVPADALIIPSAGHLDGVNSHWQSDVRVANLAQTPARYRLTFAPGGAAQTKETTIEVAPGGTIALDDIARNWYGIGALGESANGVLEILPLGASAGSPAASPASLTTIATSRTYNVTARGTLGQYIPAIPYASFAGGASGNAPVPVLSLQQIAQSPAYRTNVGLVEAANQPASVLLSVYGDDDTKLRDIAVELAPREQKQLNSLLAQYGLTDVRDGRLEVRVSGGNGKIVAYASVVDNLSQDPLLITGVPLGQVQSNRYVLPGVANLSNGFANWRTDMRVFNSGTVPQAATLTLYPQSGGAPLAAQTTVNPGQVKRFDDIVGSLFRAPNDGGAVHVTTPAQSSLVITGRTYNQTGNGTFGQFIPAVVPQEAAGISDRALEILQAEDSPRYRTNVGIAEVSGKPVTVRITVVLPDSRLSAPVDVSLGANGFVQFNVIASRGLGNVYNARVSVKVIGGEGRVAAYGSVIDQFTQDPTYVPAQ
jgi:uncharacterized repeat protein (TIGR01451 family)